jgi:hemoglobin
LRQIKGRARGLVQIAVFEETAMTHESTPDDEASIRTCVRRFYEAVRTDDLIGPVFAGAISDWDRHLVTMDDFWSASLLGTARYAAAPFAPHLKLTMNQAHFDRWRDLWLEAVDETLPEPLRGKARSIGEHMSQCWGRAYTSMKRMMADA